MLTPRLACIALLSCALGNQGCVVESTRDDQVPACGDATVRLDPGETADGYDPEELLAPYWGTFQGSLTWSDDSETAITFSVIRDLEQGVFATRGCNVFMSVYTYPKLGFFSADGGLTEEETGSLSVPLPGHPLPSATELGDYPIIRPATLPESVWRGAVAPHLPASAARYQDRALSFEVDWHPGQPRPTAARVYLEAKPSSSTVRDKILIGTIVFD